MIHYALCAFNNVVLCPNETDVNSVPGIREAAGLAGRSTRSRARLLYVTKRAHSWYFRQRIEAFLSAARSERIGLLYVVRDPRDVLTSRHARHGQPRYVELDRWLNGIRAGDYLLGALADYPDKLVLRYEDVIAEPVRTQNALRDSFGLTLRTGISNWAAAIVRESPAAGWRRCLKARKP